MNLKRKTQILVLAIITIFVGQQTKADFVFGEPENLGPQINTTFNEGLPRISSDGLSLYFSSARPSGYGDNDIWVAKRTSTKDAWEPAINLGSNVNSSDMDLWPSISSDGLTLYFYSTRDGGYGSGDIWKTTRATVNDDWSQPVNLGALINSSADDGAACISADGLELYFNSNKLGGSDLYVSRRISTLDEWGEPVYIGVLNSIYSDSGATLSSDGLIMFFQSTRTGGFGYFDLYMTTRKTINSEWSSPVNIAQPVNSPYDEIASCISHDGKTLYFGDYPWRNPRPGGVGGTDIWQVSIEPVVDLNADGIVDAADMCIIVENWGTDESLCDIGPTPFGDGVVDVQDLIVLAEYLFEEIPPAE
jgi:Tol biopolymer transport system component